MTRLRVLATTTLLAGALLCAAPASASFAADPTPDPGISTAAAAPGSGPVSVAVVMPLTVPPTTTGLIGSDALATYTRSGGLLDRELDAVAGTAAAIGLDPMIPASIRVLGSTAPADALDFLARLEAVPNDVFLLGYADADPALAAVAGTDGQLSPLGFDFAIDSADFGPAVTPSPTPTDAAVTSATPPPDAEQPVDPGAPPPLPSTADLLAWPTTLPTIAWPAEGTVGDAGLAGLDALDYDDVLLSAGNISAAASALVDLGSIDALVADDDLTAAVRDAVYAPTETEYQAARLTLVAAIRAEAITSPGRTLIATLDRRWPFGTLRLSQVLAAIDDNTSAQVVPLTAVLDGPKSAGSLKPPTDDEDADRAAVLRAMNEANRAEATYLTVAADSAVITQPRRLSLLALSAVGWRIDAVGWNAATTDALDAAADTLDSVQIVEGSDQLLLSDISSLRLQVSNSLPVAVTVYLKVTPLRPLLHVEDPSVEVTIEPDSTTKASVPVESITNGDVTVRVELHSRQGRSVGEPRFLKVILQAGWETAGTVIAGALVVLVFGGGLVRSIVRRRRAAAEGSGGSGD
jgi:Family of unknown function (DUF6049)